MQKLSKFTEIKKHLRQTTVGVVGKILIVPCIFIPICILAGYRDVKLATLMVIFAAPTAVS
ncbi:hypothetical protein [Clostridium sp. CCUG 7971]|uniref:hypothetical protein n=1 Tax=Clostridium sp. CCUG 7971 TaxID=2811414 RepID=UPI001ABB61F5|nr:hypothetical protein [Clostridium sp. CCUG 7971]MBO3444724.1 hypothetical protein [Clostridium sp. CCUG 7971]